MVTQNTNPFVLPGFGQSGDMAQNPMMASMEMMRQAWQGLAGTSSLGQAAMAAPMSVEELERRIGDLRAVENWLRMNLSMLSSTIQGMEVQRATIATLKSFMTTTASGASTGDGPSPLEVVLGIKPGSHAASGDAPSPAAAPAAATEAAHDAAVPQIPGAAAAAQGWWDMVQKQFDTLAAATTATLQGAEAAAHQVGVAASADSTLGKSARKEAPNAAPAKRAANAAPAKKTVARKRAAPTRKS
ncbi:MAG TPA: PhaM family polyhydroxyalkanoate granule multifunctional regulatory protein [Candidimonas sp.]|nr:PhaM family polyhydroxyalkanoate granule multifunctional regulatory protein [Candidimonas sp.]